MPPDVASAATVAAAPPLEAAPPTASPSAAQLCSDPGVSPRESPCPADLGGAWWNRWLAVAYLQDLEPSRPQPVTVLDRDLVLWFDRQQQQWRAFDDACPHRLVPLSEGRINAQGQLECPYHGWCFDGSGGCTAIPQAQPGASRSRRSSCHAYATASGQGLLFVFMGDSSGAGAEPLPLVPALEEEPSRWLLQDTFRDLPMDALTALENVLDVSHVPYTHHRTVGRRENAAPVQAELTGSGPGGFTAVWAEGPRRGKLGSLQTRFLAPGLMWHDLTASGFARILTVVYVTPIRRGECRLFARSPFRFNSPWPGRLLRLRPRWLQHIGNNLVLEDDQVFLHWQERAVQKRGGLASALTSFHLATSSDLYVRALLRWLKDWQGDPFPGQPLPPRQNRTSLMDRYHSHTVHCRACSTALRRLRRWRLLTLLPGLLALLPLLQSGGPSQAPLASLLAAGALAAGSAVLWWRFGFWEQELCRGAGLPPRNRA